MNRVTSYVERKACYSQHLEQPISSSGHRGWIWGEMRPKGYVEINRTSSGRLSPAWV